MSDVTADNHASAEERYDADVEVSPPRKAWCQAYLCTKLLNYADEDNCNYCESRTAKTFLE